MAINPDRAFLRDYLRTPTIGDVQRDYREPNPDLAYQPNKPFIYKHLQLRELFSSRFDGYIAQVGSIKPAVHEALVQLAAQYDQANYGRYDSDEKPEAVLHDSRLSALIRNPHFIAFPKTAESVLAELACLSDSTPWGFNMYTKYVSDELHGHYEIRPGFGAPQIAGFAALIGSERLWDEGGKQLRRVFFGSVAEALEKLAVKFPEETFEPRVELLRKNSELCNQVVCQTHGHEHTHSEIQSHLTISFRSGKEINKIAELVSANQGTLFGHELRMIARDDPGFS